MKVFKYHAPYTDTGRTTFPYTKNRTGVYLIKEDNKLVYVGYSGGNLYKTLYRHFQEWNHKTQKVISYKERMSRKKYTVRIVLCNTAKQAAALEKSLIKKYKPRDNDEKYEIYFEELPKQQENYIEKVEDLYFNTQINYGLPF